MFQPPLENRQTIEVTAQNPPPFFKGGARNGFGMVLEYNPAKSKYTKL
jgi:hypothetical protein